MKLGLGLITNLEVGLQWDPSDCFQCIFFFFGSFLHKGFLSCKEIGEGASCSLAEMSLILTCNSFGIWPASGIVSAMRIVVGIESDFPRSFLVL